MVVDNDLDTQSLLENYFGPRGFTVDSYSGHLEPLMRMELDPGSYDLILADLKMPATDRLDFVRLVNKLAPKVPIILMTANSTVETAVEAIQAGAYDFVLKPLDYVHLNISINRGLKYLQLEKENETLRREVRSTWSFEGVIGKSAAIQSVFDLAKRVAHSTANVLITGESGTGKEVIARAIHHHGNRDKSPFIAINCSAIPDNLLESELFGHSKGAFTGAIEKKLGLFEAAEGGVLFLDEIGDLNLTLQAKLLRVLQERKIRRIGENQYRDINVRVIAATHRDLKVAIGAKLFREDLFYRLCVIPIHIPALRERYEDILPLAHHFLEKFKAQNGSSVITFTKDALVKLVHLPWRGNVRELENVIERAVVLCRGDFIDVGDLPVPESLTDTPVIQSQDFFETVTQGPRPPTLEEFSQRYIEFVLKSVHGAKEQAANILEINRKTLYRRSLALDVRTKTTEETNLSTLTKH